ncbi:MAG TPA: hypothetical protein DCY42_06990 [Chloroflexi bacterium]|nr:hypothetical protein [Chloroflexota bacterium]
MTRAAHKKDFFLSVTLPLVLVVLFMISLVIAFILIPVGDIVTWSQIASIFLVALALILGLITLIIVGGLVYLVSYILKVMPPYTRMAQQGIDTIREQATRGADITVKPVIQIQSFLAAVNAIFGRKKKV